jgi:hypothetical protein
MEAIWARWSLPTARSRWAAHPLSCSPPLGASPACLLMAPARAHGHVRRPQRLQALSDGGRLTVDVADARVSIE